MPRGTHPLECPGGRDGNENGAAVGELVLTDREACRTNPPRCYLLEMGVQKEYPNNWSPDLAAGSLFVTVEGGPASERQRIFVRVAEAFRGRCCTQAAQILGGRRCYRARRWFAGTRLVESGCAIDFAKALAVREVGEYLIDAAALLRILLATVGVAGEVSVFAASDR